MKRRGYILALDQGTLLSRAIVYSLDGVEISRAEEPLAVRSPRSGWHELDAEEIWQTQLNTLRRAAAAVPAEEIRAIGIANQRETVICWDRASGIPLAPAVVWDCRRAASVCDRLRSQGLEGSIRRTTGLVMDPYFLAPKILWLLENIEGLREKAGRGEAVFGAVDSWLIWRLTGATGRAAFLTEPSNASRTMLFSLDSGDWDEDLLRVFQVSRTNLPEIRPSAGLFGETTVLGPAIPITGVVGDQQASLFGHGCLEEDTAKCTFGSGAFLLMNTGRRVRRSNKGLISTVAWGMAEESVENENGVGGGKTLTYGLEGSIFSAGSVVQWLRDNMGFVESAEQAEEIARSVPDSGGVLVVPAFAGLGAPYWRENAKGAIFGVTRETKREHVVRAAFEGVAHEVADLLELDEFQSIRTLRIDGELGLNRLFCQTLSDYSGRGVEMAPRSAMRGFGAARLAALGAELYSSVAEMLFDFRSGTEGDFLHEAYWPRLGSGAVKRERERWRQGIRCVLC